MEFFYQTKKYYISGKIHLTKTSEKTNKKGETKVYKWRDSIVDGREVEARTEKEAIEQFKEMEVQLVEADEYELLREVDFFDDLEVTTTSNLNSTE